MHKILVSACLLGEKVRYDGRAKSLNNSLWTQWQEEGRLVAICPEVAGGLAVPREAAEIEPIGNPPNGLAHKPGQVKVVTVSGQDVSNEFMRGAEAALTLAQSLNIRLAILTEGSPSCGSGTIRDGSFTGGRCEGEGVTCALLRKNGITVFAHQELELAQQFLLLMTLKVSNEQG